MKNNLYLKEIFSHKCFVGVWTYLAGRCKCNRHPHFSVTRMKLIYIKINLFRPKSNISNCQIKNKINTTTNTTKKAKNMGHVYYKTIGWRISHFQNMIQFFESELKWLNSMANNIIDILTVIWDKIIEENRNRSAVHVMDPAI